MLHVSCIHLERRLCDAPTKARAVVRPWQVQWTRPQGHITLVTCFLSPLCLNLRSAIHFLSTAPDCATSPLNMEDKTPSSGTAGLECGSLGARLLLKSNWKEKEKREEKGSKEKKTLKREGRQGGISGHRVKGSRAQGFKRTSFALCTYCSFHHCTVASEIIQTPSLFIVL